jgi:hypothetical protein
VGASLLAKASAQTTHPPTPAHRSDFNRLNALINALLNALPLSFLLYNVISSRNTLKQLQVSLYAPGSFTVSPTMKNFIAGINKLIETTRDWL